MLLTTDLRLLRPDPVTNAGERLRRSEKRRDHDVSAPRLFRVILEVSNLDAAIGFYSALLGVPGIRVSQERHYFDCGPVILAIMSPEGGGGRARPAPQPVYLATPDLDALHTRARDLNRLSTEMVHGASAGEIVTRPWGERSFYAVDPDGNGLCFVDERTVFIGR
jgi:catechol 2,3-dioxygenase-like lactoylglutathione lyase family enzyme